MKRVFRSARFAALASGAALLPLMASYAQTVAKAAQCTVVEFAELQTYVIEDLQKLRGEYDKKASSNLDTYFDFVEARSMPAARPYMDASTVCSEQKERVERLLKTKIAAEESAVGH